MKTLYHGNDSGGVMLTALVFILIFSFLFISIIPSIMAKTELSYEYKKKMLNELEMENRRLIEKHDLY